MPNPLMNALHGRAVPDLRVGHRHAWPAAACLLFAFASHSEAAPFDTLDATQRAEVADRCLPYSYERGGTDTATVRDCLERASSTARPELSLDEQYALHRLCDGDETCETRESQALAALDRNALTSLPVDERDTVRRHCRTAQDSEGPVAWTLCLREAVAELQQGPVLDRQALSFASRRAALSVCTDREPAAYRRCLQETGMPVDTSRAVPAQVSADTAGETDITRRADAPADGIQFDDPADDTTAAPDLKTRLMDSFEALDSTGRLLLLAAALLPLLLWLARRLTHRRHPDDTTHDTDGHDYATLADRARYDRDAPSEASDEFDFDFGDDPVRRARPGSENVAGRPDANEEPVGFRDEDSALWDAPPEQRLPDQLRSEAPDPFAERSRFEGEADRLFEDLDAASVPTRGEPRGEPRGAAGGIAGDAARDVEEETTRDAPLNAADDAALRSTEQVPEEVADDTRERLPEATDPPSPPPVRVARHDDYEAMSDDLVTGPLDELPDDDLDALPDDDGDADPPEGSGSGSAFGRWLDRAPDDARLTHVTEFFIYWMAYGDKRYDDDMRQTLLGHGEDEALSDERAIKRWVLLEDTDAFVDAVQWMISNASPEQCRQSVRLLIALLVPDAVPTPVQNTLLRFLADAFGLQQEGLMMLWQEGFGAPLPPLPRVDRADWWTAQDENALAERDARQVASYPAASRHAARLGLPLHGPYEAARIRTASRLAIQRAEPEAFEALGERAMTLAERQLERIEGARDALLEEALP